VVSVKCVSAPIIRPASPIAKTRGRDHLALKIPRSRHPRRSTKSLLERRADQTHVLGFVQLACLVAQADHPWVIMVFVSANSVNLFSALHFVARETQK